MEQLPTGSRILDKMLDGGYETDIITTIYGPAGSGKTNLCILCAINTARLGKKVIYVDTENNFSLERFKQICTSINLNYAKILNNIVFLRPASFEEQKKTLEKLKDLINNKIGLVIIDSIAMLYRLELGKNEDIYEVNRELAKQLAYLKEIQFDNVYAFSYSPRPGTEAAQFHDDVPDTVKEERLQILFNLQRDIAYQKNLTRVGCTEEVLVEGESRKGKGQLTGRTPHNRIVNFYGDPQNRGVIMNVKIKKAHPYSLSGEIHG